MIETSKCSTIAFSESTSHYRGKGVRHINNVSVENESLRRLTQEMRMC